MEPFEIQWRASTKKDLRKLPPQEVARIVAAVEQLARASPTRLREAHGLSAHLSHPHWRLPSRL
jgi:hypothetical protein